MLKPNPNYSDAEAEALALIHEGMITLARNQRAFLNATPGSGKRVIELERLIQASIEVLIDLGRPRVAPDLRAKGWILGEQGEWVRPYTADEYPFDAKLEVEEYGDGKHIYARNNNHARIIDGDLPIPKWGIAWGREEDHVV